MPKSCLLRIGYGFHDTSRAQRPNPTEPRRKMKSNVYLKRRGLMACSVMMCAAGGIRNLAAPTAMPMARMLKESSLSSLGRQELYFTQAEASSEPRYDIVTGNWACSLRSAGMAVACACADAAQQLDEVALRVQAARAGRCWKRSLTRSSSVTRTLVLLCSPETLFQSEGYRETGFLFRSLFATARLSGAETLGHGTKFHQVILYPGRTCLRVSMGAASDD